MTPQVWDLRGVDLHKDACPIEVVRAGEAVPCDKPPVAIRWLEYDGERHATPVCVAHCRVGEMMPLYDTLTAVHFKPRTLGFDG